MSETKHAMKLRHKAELKALAAQPTKGRPLHAPHPHIHREPPRLSHSHPSHYSVCPGIGAKKKQKDDEKLMMQRHEQELRDLDLALASKANDDAATPPSSDPPSTSALPPAAPSDEKKGPAPPAAAEDGTERKPEQAKSRTQQKRERRAAAEKERRLEVEAEVKDMADPRRDESLALARRLTPLHLRVREVVSDGNCLFRAVAAQLPAPASPSSSPSALRRAAAAHIRGRLALYLPFLTHEDGRPMEEEEGLQYCERLEKEEGEVVWGGHAEVVALSGVLGRPVVVYSAEGRDMRVLEEGATDEGEEVRISFHKHYFSLGNHYNAVVADEDDIEEEADDGVHPDPS